MNAEQTREWIELVEQLRQRLPPEMVDQVVALGAERDALATRLKQEEALTNDYIRHLHNMQADRDALARKVAAMQDKIIEAKTQMLTTIHGHCAMDDCALPSEPFRYWLDRIQNAAPEAAK